MSLNFQVYFGGTFFPPHVGHDQMLKALLAHPEVSLVHLVPTFQNPLKATPTGLVPTPELKRRLIEAWQTSLAERQVPGLSKLQIEWTELEAGVPGYTIDTYRSLTKASGPGGLALPWVLGIGDDCLADLTRWKEIEALLREFSEVWVFRRGTSDRLTFLDEIPVELRVLTTWRLMTHEILDVSSTEIRARLESERMGQTDGGLAELVLPEIRHALS